VDLFGEDIDLGFGYDSNPKLEDTNSSSAQAYYRDLKVEDIEKFTMLDLDALSIFEIEDLNATVEQQKNMV
jgi:hypothetical protein